MTETKRRRKLNAEQLEVLELLYKFRFGTNDLLAQYFGKKDRSFVFKRLSILLEQGLIGKRFESSYRIQGKPAAYYLMPSGARILQAHRPDRAINIKAIYKDKAVSDDFVEYCLKLLGLYCQLRVRYGGNLKFFTKSQLAAYEYFKDFVPGAYIRLEDETGEKDFFLEYLQETKPIFSAIRRLKEYAGYANSGEWEAGTDSDFPALLLVCDSKRLNDRLMKKAGIVLDEVIDDLKFHSTTPDNLDEWRDLTNQHEEPKPLASI